MQPNHHFARILFFAGILLLFSVPVFMAVIKSTKTKKLKNDQKVFEERNSDIENPKCCDKSDPKSVTIII